MRPFLISRSYAIRCVLLRRPGESRDPFIMAPGVRDPSFAAARRVSVYEAVELGGVLAGDLVHYIGRQIGELLGDVARGFRPDAVRSEEHTSELQSPYVI